MATSKEKLQIIVDAQGIAKTKAQLRGMEKATGGTTKSFGLMTVGIAGATAALYAMGKATSFAIRVGKEFEQGMANVKAISGATGAEFKALEANARKLGASTKFTATEVAGLQTEFSKLGFTATEINKVTAGTLALAAATGSDLAVSAEVAGATLRGFGLDVSETGKVTDVMAKSFSSSALDMSKFSDSMKFVAPVAKMAGFQIEGTTAILGQLANAGLHGSMAGTALRSIFLKLADTNSALSKRLGGSVNSVEELIPALNKLKDEGVDLTEMLELTDKRAVTAFGVLLDGSDDVNVLAESLRNAGGAAQTMADIQLDTLEGKMTIMKSATEGLGIAIFETFDDELKIAVENITDMIGAISEWVSTPLSDNLREEKGELNALTKVLGDYWDNLEVRNELFKDIQTQYPDFLKNLDLEKTSYEDILKLLNDSNESFEHKIKLAVNEERLKEALEKQLSVRKRLIEAEVALAKQEQTGHILRMQFSGDGEIAIGSHAQVVELLKGKLEDATEEYQNLRKEIGFISETPMVFAPDFEPFDMFANIPTEDGKAPGFLGTPTDDQITEHNNIMAQFREQSFMDQLNAFQQSKEWEILNWEERMEIISFYGQKEIDLNKEVADNKKKIKDIEFHTTMEHYSKLAGGTSAFLKNFAGGEKAAARIQQVKVGVDTISATMKSFAQGGGWPGGLIPAAASAAYGAAQMMAISQSIGEFKTAQTGMDEIISSPTLIMAGEGGKAEHIGITPLEGPNIDGPQGGGSVTVNVSGNVMTEEFTTDQIIPAIREALRRGENLDHAHAGGTWDSASSNVVWKG